MGKEKGKGMGSESINYNNNTIQEKNSRVASRIPVKTNGKDVERKHRLRVIDARGNENSFTYHIHIHVRHGDIYRSG